MLSIRSHGAMSLRGFEADVKNVEGLSQHHHDSPARFTALHCAGRYRDDGRSAANQTGRIPATLEALKK
jgi:hypothetical protein